jgi:hypothetical protein
MVGYSRTTKRVDFSTMVQMVLFLVLTMCGTTWSATVTQKTTTTSQEDLPRPTPYPNAFSIQFVTNVTQVDATHPINGTLSYAWSIPAQRIDHAAGSYECVHFYKTHQACSLVFLASGMYRLLHLKSESNNGEKDCCLDLPGIGPPPPDWASASNNQSITSNGLVYDRFSQRSAHMWSFDKNVTDIHTGESSPLQEQVACGGGDYRYGYHTMRQVAEYGKYYGRPLVFTFPGKAEGRQDFHYQVETMLLGPPGYSPFLFQLPPGCANKACG